MLGLAYNTANLVCYYRQAGTGTLTAVSLVTQTVTGAYSSGGFVQISSTNAPGQYRFDIPNVCLATAGEWNITFSGTPAGTAGNMETHTIKVIVTALDFYTSAATAVMTTQMAESYAAISTVPTPAQALLAIQQFLQNFSISGATLTMNNIVAGTAQQTYTLNNSSNPTGIVRAT